MSFRLRVLALVALVGVTATGATAWLTLRQATQQINEAETAGQAEIETITTELTEYGHRHGTWEGVVATVRLLQQQTGQRIRLVTESGEVLVDTDHLAGSAAREVAEPPISINPRPVLELPAGDARELDALTMTEIERYREGVLLAACLTRAGHVPLVTEGPLGVPHYSAGPAIALATVERCLTQYGGGGGQDGADAAAVAACTDPAVASRPGAQPAPTDTGPPGTAVPDGERSQAGTGAVEATRRACLQRAFTQQTSEVAPQPLRAYLGVATDGSGAPVSAGPVLIAAGLVAVLALAGSMLLSRRVLRPIGALTSASQRLGAGDLSERVPVVGRDELAGLAQSFNRMADSLQRGEERQRRLVADAAHELRTPLANLRGYLEALKDGVVSPDSELFASLHEEAVLQQRIVDDLQDLALAEAGSLVYHRSRVDLADLLETCRITHQAVAEAGQVRLVTSVAGPVPVAADPDRLRQVLGNLVTNALRATGPGGSVTLAAQRAGAYATVTVADTGSGIAPAQLPYIFDRFWRADAARGRTTGGSGLGLAIARQIVSDHDGRISVASEQGVGTTFTITLPPG